MIRVLALTENTEKLVDLARWFRELGGTGRAALLAQLEDKEYDDFQCFWEFWARPAQLRPAGDWRVWLICAGRGFGKTRAGAEWVRQIARDPQARIALVGASLGETRSVMVEGESGILAISPPLRRPQFEPSLRRLTWPNGARATLYYEESECWLIGAEPTGD